MAPSRWAHPQTPRPPAIWTRLAWVAHKDQRHCHKQPAAQAWVLWACKAQGEEDTDARASSVETLSSSNHVLFHQVSQEGDLGHIQKEDDKLRHCWGQVRQIDVLTNTLTSDYLLNFSYQMECQGQMCNLLMMPHSKTLILIHLAHTHLLGGHLGSQNTLEKLWDRFLWPSIDAEIRTFCRQCPQCTEPWKLPPMPLIPQGNSCCCSATSGFPRIC